MIIKAMKTDEVVERNIEEVANQHCCTAFMTFPQC